ncbi:helix-turn-helix transcriptional regulator [Paraburkholderia caballeronis]|uniref:Predicted transcriptional regulator YheO, contains PAS and DNA-binding HTH domains n=1 Tax=Paraburkholderia caballeronis TaxID=416943 RepID=A0A1H7HZ70_9BURK|nr:PAS domain-containing protein [Paraburkholderia caballeronis]PXW29294.1 putative transcriptional regulator YheO [Paraburkholderia caballeronis]PXX04553.1 putative transcriptional regulator YheO [Paraburkholderia caballeronis]RAK05614.1 putative transcriptional regulator YheO [Paraburkholderia caballeronis]SEC95699.1 Predicted transcriptional regulator YheO, contains PAS and DNA-binding HTH domains [Paraburkholderia caballeronis]SEK55581.1 Predicted transcriptional regulator YheO, contains P
MRNVDRENQLLLREGRKIVEALGQTLAPLVEVVLHDLSRPGHSVVAIANNLSGRSVGDAVTEMGLARITDPGFPEVVQNYPNRFPDGRPAKSTSIGLKNSAGDYVAAICLNMDVSLLGAVTAGLGQLMSTAPSSAPVVETLASRQLGDVRATLERFAAARNTTPIGLTLAQRRDAVRELADAGLLNLRHALSEVARTLGVARSTVYTYLPTESRP